MSENVMTPRARVSFPNLFKPSKPKGAPAEQEEKYSVTLLFDKGEDLSKLKKACADAAKEKWGDSVPANLRSPFRDQGEKEFDGYVPGAIFINISSKQKPGVVDASVQDILDESEVYAGCYGRATVRAYAYGGKGTTFAPGVALGLQNFQKLEDGESLAGRVKPEDEFAPVAGAGVGASDSDGGDDIFG